jgi:sulfite reductase (NADPH) flavoprotein alpha-component
VRATSGVACPLAADQLALLDRLVTTLTPEQRRWVAAYLEETAPEFEVEAPTPLVLYGTETGNARRLAERLTRRLGEVGVAARLLAMDAYRPRALPSETLVVVVVSTHGDGEPPDNARDFYDFLMSARAPRLDGLLFAVLALGDRSYPAFCKTGRDVAERLATLGASPLIDVGLVDAGADDVAEAWMETLLRHLPTPTTLAAVARPHASPRPDAAVAEETPCPATVLENLRLTGRGSDKDVRHLELAVAQGAFRHRPGDALGVLPENDPALVDAILEATGWPAELPVRLRPHEDEVPLAQALRARVEITRLVPETLASLAADGVTPLASLVGDEAAARAYCEGRDLLDLCRDVPLGSWPPALVVPRLRPLAPRLYSIASSAEACPGEVHLTVRVVDFTSHGRLRRGVASGHLAARSPGEEITVFLRPNPDFRPPADPRVPMVLIAAGTGVAPFRAFLQEEELCGASRRIWLFFGERRFRTDFLYQVEWQRWRAQGLLTRIDVAFSRDEPRRRVPECLRAQGRDLWAWLEEGAHLYVCGGLAFARDVEAALLAVARTEGGLGAEAAGEALRALRREGRYRRDVY